MRIALLGIDHVSRQRLPNPICLSIAEAKSNPLNTAFEGCLRRRA